MVSQNILLGSGVPEPKPSVHIEPKHERTPAWRFHRDFPEGKLCKTDEELDQADAGGWLDHPGKVRLLPGHEKVWEVQKLLEADSPDEIKEEGMVEPVKSEDAIKADILKAESDKIEAKRLKEYEEAKNPQGPRLCTLCGKEFKSIRALNMHGIATHKNKK